jgi:integrase
VAERGKSEGSTYEIKSGPQAGMWRGAVVVGWKDGKPDRVTRTRKTKKLAKAALREVLNARDSGQLRVKASDWTVGEWMPHWVAHLQQVRDDGDERALAQSTIDEYESVTRVWIVPTIGTVRLDRFDERHHAQVITAMKAKVGPSRRHHAHIALTLALKWAKAQKILTVNPLADVQPPPQPKKKTLPYPREEAVAIYQAALEDDDFRERWIAALDNGVRQGEALGAAWPSLHLDTGTIRVEQQLRRLRGRHACGAKIPAPAEGKPDRTQYPCGHLWASKCPAPGARAGALAILPVKTARGNRVLPLSDETVPMLRALQKRQRRDRMVHGQAYHRYTLEPGGRIRELTTAEKKLTGRDALPELDLVFRHRDGRLIDPHEDWESWYALLDAAGVAGGKLHRARHTWARDLLDAGVSLALLGDLAGHASHSFTKDVYGSFSPEAAEDARDKLAELRAAQRKKAEGKPRKREA